MMENPGDVRQAYDLWAEVYDTDENPTRDLNAHILRDEVEIPVGARVLELGCGTGINTIRIAEHAKEVVAIDFSEHMLERARERVSWNNVSFLRADVTTRWQVDGPFDLIVVNLVLEHIADVHHVFREAARVLSPSGVFYVAELHPFKQLLGSQARFSRSSDAQDVRVPVVIHSISEFVAAGSEAGLQLARIAEWADEEGDVPRLLTMWFEHA